MCPARILYSCAEILTCAAEQEITGDVLLELDANILKSEIGITAFGKRVRIVNAISELRRPPSVEEVERPEPQAAGSMLTPRSLTHSFHYPASNGSHRSHSHSHSVQSSAHQSFNNSPFGPPSPSVLNGNGQMALAALTSPESPPANGDQPGTPPTMAKTGWRASDPGSIHGSVANVDEDPRGRSPVGLGLGLPNKGAKLRPPQLSLSPSDSAIRQTGGIVQGKERRDSLKDERAVLSEVRFVLSVAGCLSSDAEDNVAVGGRGPGFDEQAPSIWSIHGLWVFQGEGEGRGEHTVWRDPSQLATSVSFAR